MEKKTNWFLKHWIISSFLFIILLSGFMSGFEKGENKTEVYNIPEHSIIKETKLIGGDNMIEVLIASISKDTPKLEIQSIARDLSNKYSSQQVEIYCSLEAQKANYSSSFAEDNPGAIEKCYLGHYDF